MLKEHLAAGPPSLSLLQVSWIIPNEDAGIQSRGHRAGRRISQLQRPAPGSVGSEWPLTGGQKEPWKEQSQAFVPVHRVVGSQRTDLFKVTSLSCFPRRNISGKMCFRSLLFFEGKISRLVSAKMFYLMND